KLEKVLKNSYGVAIYQEQVMQMACELAGFSMTEADNLRRAMSKKKADVMQKMRATFVKGCRKESAIEEEEANRLFDLIDYFSGYGFNRSHSAAYAFVSYRTAWLKANYPVEFMCALLTNEKDNIDKIVEYRREALAMGIRVLPPDVNESRAVFRVTGDDRIRYGLLGVKNVGLAAIESLVGEREKDGPFASVYDLCRRVDTRTNNRKVLESLIKCGALDSFGVKRSQMMASLDEAMASGTKRQREEAVGQMSFFGMGEDNGGFSARAEVYPEMKEWPQPQILSFEKELLGFYLSGHPLERYEVERKLFTNATTATLSGMREEMTAVLIALLSHVKLTTTKKTGERMAILGVEDLEGSVEALVFPKAYQQAAPRIKEGAIVVVKGKVSREGEAPKIFIDEIGDISDIYRMVRMITLDMTKAGPEKLALIRKKLELFPGKVPVHLRIDTKNHRSVEIKVGQGLFVAPNEVLMEEIKALVGEGACKVSL
ncbi:MAG: DNA polymerase III subunit alpha, partial [Elusimicrobia bacterium]|nr:DNA polymerase III subunit alpha [Elusimicrobiota bacterium]